MQQMPLFKDIFTLQSNQFQNFKLEWFSNNYRQWYLSSLSKHRLFRLHRLIGCQSVNHLSGILVFVKTFDIFLNAFGNRLVFLIKHVAIFELLKCIVMSSIHCYTSHLECPCTFSLLSYGESFENCRIIEADINCLCLRSGYLFQSN